MNHAPNATATANATANANANATANANANANADIQGGLASFTGGTYDYSSSYGWLYPGFYLSSNLLCDEVGHTDVTEAILGLIITILGL